MSLRHSTATVFLLLAAAAVLTQPCAPASAQAMDPPEFRSAWADTWHNGFLSPDETSTLVDTLAEFNYNAVIAEVRKGGDAYYNSAYEPWATNISEPGYDPLADLVAKAHAKGIEVHAWIVTYRIWRTNWAPPPPDHVWNQHPEWAMYNRTGGIAEGYSYNLDPGVPGVQQYICDVAKDIVSNYDVDGFNWDYIRYPGYKWGYNPIVKERFRAEYGSYPPTSSWQPNWGAWCDFRRRQVTDLVRKTYAELVHINPNVKVSADTVGWMGADPNVDFTQTRQYADVYQDSKGWMQEHILDMNVLMNYKREYNPSQQADFRLWTDFIAANKFGRHSICGPAAYLNAIPDTVTQLLYARGTGCDGMSTYSYAVTNKDGQPAEDFLNAVKADVFTLPALTPDMPWKTAPTDGILFGQITDASGYNDPIYQNWVYKAAVTADGPVTKTTVSDATGTYVFTDLPPGDYAVSVTATGFQPASANGAAAAGIANRLDIELEPIQTVNIGEAIDLPDGTEIRLLGNAVTAPTGAIAGCIYIEQPDRASGIQVRLADPACELAEGDRLNLVGVLATENGERILDQAEIVSCMAGDPLGALAVSIKHLDLPPTTTGLLVQCAGEVTASDAESFTLDDGSGSVTVLCPGKTVPGPGSLARVTGISSMAPGPTRVMRVRYQSDIENPPTETYGAPSGAVAKGFNLIGVPCVPTDPAPGTVFSGLDIDGKLLRWDGSIFSAYDGVNPTAFGGVLRGEGYGLNSQQDGGVSYQAITDEGAADMRVTLPQSGWNLVSQPFAAPTHYAEMLVTDGCQTLSVRDAVQAGWIMPLLFTWDNATQRLGHVWLKSKGKRQIEDVMPWEGYWARTHKDDLALIIPRGDEQ